LLNTEKPLVDENNIQVTETCKDWKEAIKLASKPLLKENKISTIYVNNMIESVKQNGPYMVLTDYFALMHARPGVGVNQMGMSLLIVKKPVDLEGKPVKIFLVMAAVDNTSHLSSLQKIMKIFMDDKAYQTILEGNKEKILEIFKEGR
jgi:PTS system ascorbate-specific IIA component